MGVGGGKGGKRAGHTVEDDAGLVGEVDGDAEGLADPGVVEVAEGVRGRERVGGGVADVEGVALGGGGRGLVFWMVGGGSRTYP